MESPQGLLFANPKFMTIETTVIPGVPSRGIRLLLQKGITNLTLEMPRLIRVQLIILIGATSHQSVLAPPYRVPSSVAQASIQS
jgi:hypothetical protein